MSGDRPVSDALVFFGATGDLAYKKIFPALQQLVKRGKLDSPVIGVAKSGWNHDQLVPAEYVAASTTYQSSGDSTGLAAYGYQWWVTNAYGLNTYFALGFGSQYIYVAPDRDLVVVVVKGFDDPPELVTASRPLIENYVLAGALPQ